MLLAHETHGRPDGPPVVLIHGITESRGVWKPLIGGLGETFHLLLVDLRGHGVSEVVGPYDPPTYANDVIETMTATGFEGASVIGHSLGGIVASAVAATGGAARVVNIDQSMQLGTFKESLTGVEPLLRGNQAEFDSAIDLIFGGMLGPLAPPEIARIDALQNACQDVVLGAWASVFESTPEQLDATVAELAETIDVPYLAIHGSDPGAGYAGWLAGLIGSAAVETWDDHGHYPHLVDPERFTARMRAFIPS